MNIDGTWQKSSAVVCAVEFYGQAERAISSGKLNVLPRLHIRPYQTGPRSLVTRCSSERSAIFPWPIQAMKSWFLMWLAIHRPVSGCVMGPCQAGMRSCTYGSHSLDTRVNAHVTLRVFSSSTGTRHSK